MTCLKNKKDKELKIDESNDRIFFLYGKGGKHEKESWTIF